MDVAEQIKERLPLVDWLAKQIKIERRGRLYVGLCPFHDEAGPSFTTYPDQDTFHCFGCGAHGDLFTYFQRTHNCDFKEALRELAREAGVELRQRSEEVAAYNKARSRAAILGDALECYRRNLADEHRAYLRKRGFTDEFIDTYRFGFAPSGGGLKKALPQYTQADLHEAGLVNAEGRAFFWNRLIIPVYGREAEVVNLVGRVWGDYDPEDKTVRKYLRLPGTNQLLNERGLRGTEVLHLCEGDLDTATLVQAGLPVVGIPGAAALKEDYLPKFKRVTTLYLYAHPDEAGTKTILRAGELFGNRVRVATLPAGEDINSWVGQKGNDLAPLTESAQPYIDYLVARLPADVPADQADQVLAPLLAILARVGKAGQDLYVKQIAKRLGLPMGTIKEALREKAAAEAAEPKKAGPDAEGRIIWKDVRPINPAQDYVDGTMYTVAFLDVLTVDPETEAKKLETLPYVITSAREVFPVNDVEAYRRGLRITPTKVPLFSIVGRRWSMAEEEPHSVKSFLDSGASVSPWEVYTEVVGYFRKFVDYPDELYYDFLALWTIGTYFYNLYQAFPYVHLTGTKRVGKSLSLKIIGELAFNALFSSSMSSAAAYRSVEACSTTLLLDEAENLQKKNKNDDQDDKIEILKAGYMKGPKAIRCSGDNHEPTGFDVYSPKMFGSIQSMDRILADRAITLTLARKRRDLPEFDFQEAKREMARTRDKLYVLMLEHAKDIAEEIRAGIGWDGVQDRERELWTPVLTLATFFDCYQMDEAGGVVTAEQLLTTRMRLLAFRKGEEKLAKEQSEQTELLILEGLLDFLKTATPASGMFYPTTALLSHMQGIEELAWLKDSRQVMRELERLTIIQNKKRDAPRLRDGAGKQVRTVRLDPVRVQEIARRYGAAGPVVPAVPANIGG